LPRKAVAPVVAAEAAAQGQDSVWAAASQVVAARVVVEARAAPADPEEVALALAVPVAVVAAELMPVICGVRRGRVVEAEAGERLGAREAEAQEAALVVEVVPAAELGSVVAAVWAVAEARAPAPAVPVVEVALGAAHPVQSALRERRERRLENG